MGRGGAQLGKPLKGAGIATKTILESVTSVNKNLTQLEQYAKDKRVLSDKLNKLLVNAAECKAGEHVSYRRATARWRSLMRTLVAGELRDEKEVRFFDALQTGEILGLKYRRMMADYAAIEEQTRSARTGTSEQVDRILSLFDTCLLTQKHAWDAIIERVRADMDTEASAIQDDHLAAVTHMKATMDEIWAEDLTRSAAQIQGFDTEREAQRNRSLEAIHMLRVATNATIEKLEGKFDDAHQTYMESTEERTREFNALKASDKAMSVQIERQVEMIERTTAAIQACRKKLSRRSAEGRSALQAMHNEKNILYGHYQDLQERIRRVRSSESNNLKEVAKRSRARFGEMQTHLDSCQRILKLADLISKAQTGTEKAGVSIRAPIADPSSAMSAFIGKLSEARLDVLRAREERDAVRKENAQIKALLSAYMDGISVRDDSVDGENALLIVNGRVNVREVSRAPRQYRRPPIVEGANVARLYVAHAAS
ncbi:unnamed protein product (mitochondrion) [Plasmodiophora brassicae]|uniref:Dynein regulatory complex protein 1/2 N-terminal domain-containing protein n=1 Tax=Plasmodiophora brassicae TaxID=37360 RepID=A0A0G4IRQ0_PLABS|nr:hypothetical protein PBRA_006059 [Plasmodiophora brassicae]SPQ98159.1 unnamed protein product [Plasmodiophora brassicae]